MDTDAGLASSPCMKNVQNNRQWRRNTIRCI
nr:MAG TPA: Protein of unknown function (DUF2682) [Caudoviricetes sp.]